MQYRPFGKTKEKVSLLGLGCMRLPLSNPAKPESIEIDLAKNMVYKAIDGGVNYIDTAYGYHDEKSEPFVGEVLENGLRKKVYLATKLPVWYVKEETDMERLIIEQLTRLRTNYLDMYLLHALNRNSFNSVQSLGVFPFLDRKKKEGAIRYAGFSFHDELPVFKEIVDAYDWDFCQIQLNYLDTNYQAGLEGMEYAAKKGIAVIIMEPLKGGKLSVPPESIKTIFKSSQRDWDPTQWAFHWLGNYPQVHLILSGMSSMQQIEENIHTFDSVLPNQMTSDDHRVIAKVTETFQSIKNIACTRCQYCMPCPQGVNIPDNFDIYNNAFLFDKVTDSRVTYQKFMGPKRKASNCIACRECEPKCPQQLSIANLMKEVDAFLSQPIS